MKTIIVTLYAVWCLHSVLSDKLKDRMVFEDNFDGNSLNLDKWEYWEGPEQGEDAQNLQCYQKENVAVQNGKLILTAKKEEKKDKQYTSGGIRQRDPGFANATYAVRARLARGNRLRSTFRLVSSKDSDTYEGVGLEYTSSSPDSWEFQISHFDGKPPNTSFLEIGFPCNVSTCRSERNATTDFDVYIFLWGDRFSWHIHKAGLITPGVYKNPLQFLLNLEVGESFKGEHGDMWEKPTIEIDWVRVYYNVTPWEIREMS